MPDPKNPPSNPDSPHLSGPDLKASRRRLLQGGLAAAPVLMTLVSRPVLAQQCTTPSGYVSLGASTAGRGVTCMGHIPSVWATSSQWPSGYSPSTRFLYSSQHGGVFTNSPYSPSTTLLDVLKGVATPHNSTTDNVASYVVAALLNAAAGLTPVLLVPAVKDIWKEYGATGYGTGGSFSPFAGAHWSPSEIVDYLLRTMS